MIPSRDLERALVWTLAALAPLAALALVVGFVFEPDAIARGAPWHALGFAAPTCPGCALCGMTRAFAAAGHLRPGAALALHPGVVLAWPLAWIVALGGPWLAIRSLTATRSPLRRRACRSRP